MTRTIAVVGGGISGLSAAWHLEQETPEKLNIELFEASDRLGGMIQTSRFDTVPLPYEAGAAELYDIPHTPALKTLITETLGLPTVSMEGSPTIVLRDRILRNEGDVADTLGASAQRALREFMASGKALRSPEQYARAGWPQDNDHPWVGRTFASLLADVPDPAAREYLAVQVHCDLACEPGEASGVFGFDNLLIDEPDYCRLYAVRGGNEQLPAALAERLSAQVHRDTRVKSVWKQGETYCVAAAHQGSIRVREFDAVVCALPHRRIRSVNWKGSTLPGAMESHWARYNHPTHYLRVTCLFREPFWREVFDESYYVHDAFGGVCVYDESSRFDAKGFGVLSWLLAGRPAWRWHMWCDPVIVKAALKRLPPQVAHGRDTFLEGKVNRWIRGVSARPGGLPPFRGVWARHLPDPEGHPGLFAAGDYHFDSTINGALDSGRMAAAMALCHLGLRQEEDFEDEFGDSATRWGTLRQAPALR